jgi:Fic family protein
MVFTPKYNYTHSIVKNLGIIEAARAVIDVLPLPLDTVLRLRHDAFERSTRSSTAIEGNTLDENAIRRAVAGGRTGIDAEQEVRNYWRALDRLEEFADKKASITEAFIQEVHKIVLAQGPGRPGGKSPYRVLECPVVDQGTGMIDYAPPKPEDVPLLVEEMVQWLSSSNEIPAIIRAGILSHRFISVHPFNDGNGRTGRLLATAELWRSSYKMRGFLSFEEYFNADRNAYYESLQMGLPVNFYDGRNDCDLTRWLEYFINTLAIASDKLRREALLLQEQKGLPSNPWDQLPRRQQQVLVRLLARIKSEKSAELIVKPMDVESWFAVSDRTAREWLSDWVKLGFVKPISTGAGDRIHKYELISSWRKVLEQAS